jgi:three-Cys-motif partner protein
MDPHTRGKHLVLKGYLDAWFPILGSWTGRILFIDGFAGPGEYTGGEPGSPIIALNALREHRARDLVKAEVIFFFVEKDSARARHLEELVGRLKPALPRKCVVEVQCGSFDTAMTEVLDAVDAQKAKLAPAFLMVDPFGVSGTPMAVLQRFLGNPRSEVYVSFMYEALNRFKDTPEFARHLDALFGTPDWREGIGIDDGGDRKDFYYGLYERQLRAAGAEQVVRFELYEGNRLVYAILFATRSTKGADRMKEAIWKVAPFGDFVFRGTRSPQLGLELAAPDFGPLREALLAEYMGRGWIDIRDIEEFIASDRTDYYTSQLRKGALVPLEQAGQLEVDEDTRRRARTYPAGTKLRFA